MNAIFTLPNKMPAQTDTRSNIHIRRMVMLLCFFIGDSFLQKSFVLVKKMMANLLIMVSQAGEMRNGLVFIKMLRSLINFIVTSKKITFRL